MAKRFPFSPGALADRTRGGNRIAVWIPLSLPSDGGLWGDFEPKRAILTNGPMR